MELLVYLKERDVLLSVYSLESTDKLILRLEKVGLYQYFDLVMGIDILSPINPYTDATRKSEEVFRLDKVHKYVVVCGSDSVVESAVQEGIRTILVRDGRDISAELEEKCWKSVDSIDKIYDMFTELKILFE